MGQEDPFRAPGGRPSQGPPVARLVEGLGLFVAVPVGLAWAMLIEGWRVPVLLILAGMSVLVGGLLLRDRSFHLRPQLAGRFQRAELLAVLTRFGCSALALLAVLALASPGRLFRFPLERPGFWALVMVGYPVLSVAPQEFLYRTFFFHRYGAWLGRWTVGASAAAFCLAHLLFGNWVALALTWVGGLYFASTFRRSGSLLLVSIEHALYGQLLFTIGLGEFFYAGTQQALGG